MGHEPHLYRYLPEMQQGVAIEVGAHQGLWASQLVSKFQKVILIEADAENAAVLREKHWGNVDVIEAAGWTSSGHTLEFHVRGGDKQRGALAALDVMQNREVRESVMVSTLAIDDLQLTSLDFLKIDVEGAELQVVQGASRMIDRFQPVMVIECHEPEHRAWLSMWLERMGYNVQTIHNPDHGPSHPVKHLVAHHYRSQRGEVRGGQSLGISHSSAFALCPPTENVSVDLAHATILAGVVASTKPDLVLELGYGGGYTTNAILQALRWNTRGRLIIVDNWFDWNGIEPPGIAGVTDAEVVVCDEEQYVRNCESQKFDILVSDADHSHSHKWVEHHFRIVKQGGILFFHDVTNDGFVNLRAIVEFVRDRGYPHFLFNKSSRSDENCHRGWLMVANGSVP